MTEMKKVIVLRVDDDIESVIIHHPSGDEEVVVLGCHEIEDDEDAGDDAEASPDRL